ncbi:MAG: acyl carrier protein [Ruminococcaceae bacterium]|nr:acyl carrier protein [Oscillospiraceae bacterium]
MQFEDFLTLLGEEFDFDTAGIEEDTTFADINFDEFDLIELVMSIEDKYHVEIEDDFLQHVQTIGEFAAYLKEKLD